MKLLNLTLSNGQSTSINSEQIKRLYPIINEDFDAKTRISLNDNTEILVIESISEIENLIKS